MVSEDEKKKVMQSQGVKFARPAEEAPLPPTRSDPVQSKRMRKRMPKKFVLIIFFLALFLVVSYGVYRGRGHFQSVFNLPSFLQSTPSSDYGKTIEEVSKLVALPPGEDPTVATVTSLEPLRGQEFFKGAKVGDKVLIFSKSKKAILYRPSEKRVIAMAPLDS